LFRGLQANLPIGAPAHLVEKEAEEAPADAPSAQLGEDVHLAQLRQAESLGGPRAPAETAAAETVPAGGGHHEEGSARRRVAFRHARKLRVVQGRTGSAAAELAENPTDERRHRRIVPGLDRPELDLGRRGGRVDQEKGIFRRRPGNGGRFS
jgi:hypothetical protein